MLVKCANNDNSFKVDSVFYFVIKGDTITLCSEPDMIESEYILDRDVIVTCEVEEWPISVNMVSVDGIINRFGPYPDSVSLTVNHNELKINRAHFKNCYSVFVDEYVL